MKPFQVQRLPSDGPAKLDRLPITAWCGGFSVDHGQERELSRVTIKQGQLTSPGSLQTGADLPVRLGKRLHQMGADKPARARHQHSLSRLGGRTRTWTH
jgi:hypothetical protein